MALRGATGKSFSEVLILTSNNPQYDKRLSIELPVQFMKIPISECCLHKLFWMSKQKMFSECYELGIFMYWTGNSMSNLLSYCGLVDVKIRASDIDLPVTKRIDGFQVLKI